jgi:phosphohistidine swiveling domain-containing protein
MSWSKIASGLFASKPGNLEGAIRVITGLQSIVDLVRDQSADPGIIVTNLAAGSAVSTIIQHAKAIVSTIGGPNSHIVVVARDHGIPCIVGASELDLSGLANGVIVRLRSNGHIEMENDERARPSTAQLRLLRKIAFATAISSGADIIGCPPDSIDSTLQELAAARLVKTEGVIMLTTAGTSLLEAAYAKDRQKLRDKDRTGLLTEFRPLGRELKQLARRWQDAENREDWDERLACVEALSGLHFRTEAFIRKYENSLPRLEEYRERFARAMQWVHGGSTEYVVSSKLDSYHTIWFQLHEDLLRVLQRERDPE